MSQAGRSPGFDPYQPLAQGLAFGDALNRWILSRPRRRIVQLLKGQRVLDVCCGTGNLTVMLAAAGCVAVGVDSSPTMLAQARQKPGAAQFQHMDAARLPFQHEFDAAVISIALHEMPPPAREQVWDGMRRAVRPGGRLIALDFAAPTRNSLSARLASRLVEQDERSFLNIYPPHYENFQEFMRGGGLLAWVQTRGQPVAAEYRYLGGTLAVVVTGASDGLEQGPRSFRGMGAAGLQGNPAAPKEKFSPLSAVLSRTGLALLPEGRGRLFRPAPGLFAYVANSPAAACTELVYTTWPRYLLHLLLFIYVEYHNTKIIHLCLSGYFGEGDQYVCIRYAVH